MELSCIRSLHSSLSTKCITLTLRCIYRLFLRDTAHMTLMKTVIRMNDINAY